MAVNVKIRLNRRGLRELLQSDAVQTDLARRAQAIAQAAGPGHRVETDPTPNRARAAVITDTFEARRREATQRALTSAIDAGRR